MTIWRVEYMYNAPGEREHPEKHSIMDNQVCAQLQDMGKNMSDVVTHDGMTQDVL